MSRMPHRPYHTGKDGIRMQPMERRMRLPFDEAGNPLDEETLQKRIQDYNPNTHLNHE